MLSPKIAESAYTVDSSLLIHKLRRLINDSHPSLDAEAL
jgi:hypothetical protein